jgi:hypothetical protein
MMLAAPAQSAAGIFSSHETMMLAARAQSAAGIFSTPSNRGASGARPEPGGHFLIIHMSPD